jgi:hypothetical protein
MWLFIWILFVLCVAGFFIWSYISIYEQKKAWKYYASKTGLEYHGGKLSDLPTMTGFIKDHKANFYPQIVQNEQGQRNTRTVIEIFLKETPTVFCTVTSPGFSDFIAEIGLHDTFVVDDSLWPKKSLAYTVEDTQPALWFQANKNRVQAIADMMKLPFETAFVADGEQAFIAIRTVNPLSEPRRLNQIVMKMIAICALLESSKNTSPQTETTANPNEDRKTEEQDTSAPSE